MKIAIIGAGASGLMLASYLSQNSGVNVTIFEKNTSSGRKLLASGNGKANICNSFATPKDYNHFQFVENVFKCCNKEEVLHYLSNLGLFMKSDEEGRVYPISESSQSVLRILLQSLRNCDIHYDYVVKSIISKDNKYLINDCNKQFDIVVLATGSKASIDEKKQNLCYDYLSSLGLCLTKLKSSLVALKTKQSTKILSGLRFKAKVGLYRANDELIHEELGEVLFKDEGIGGIVILNMSSYYAKEEKDCIIIL